MLEIERGEWESSVGPWGETQNKQIIAQHGTQIQEPHDAGDKLKNACVIFFSPSSPDTAVSVCATQMTF